MQWFCEYHFPNGNILHGLWSPSPVWSSDGLYATMCVGATHDSPCSGFEVWDMVNGIVVKGFFPYRVHQWSPEGHILVYLVEHSIEGIPADLVEFDPATVNETVLQECPEWFRQPCPASPGVVVSGRVVGLPSLAQAVIQTYALDEGGRLRGYQTVERDNGVWQQLLRESFGRSFRIVIECVADACRGYTAIPQSYDLCIEGTQVTQIWNGQRRLIEPNSLDFALVKR